MLALKEQKQEDKEVLELSSGFYRVVDD